MKRKNNYWSEQAIHQELITICAGTGVFPSNTDLIKLGRGDLANQIVKKGGFIEWAKKLGYKRNDSASDFGWKGEAMALVKLCADGLEAVKADRLRSPYDIIISGCLRVDVKSAQFAQYGACKGWFYRIGKHSQSDIIMLYQTDTNEAYYIPWYICPTTNVTISVGGGIYKQFKDNLSIVKLMLQQRKGEAIEFDIMLEKHG